MREKKKNYFARKVGNLPSWATSAHDFWHQDEVSERGTQYREIRMALPNELSMEEQCEVIRDFCRENLETMPIPGHYIPMKAEFPVSRTPMCTLYFVSVKSIGSGKNRHERNISAAHAIKMAKRTGDTARAARLQGKIAVNGSVRSESPLKG